MLHYIGPEGPMGDGFYRMRHEGDYRQTEAQRQEFQTEVLLAYFGELNNGEEDLIVDLRARLLDGRLRIKWMEYDGEPFVALSGDDRRRFVEAVFPQDLFDLIAPDCRYYREMTNSPVAELMEWAGKRLGILLGLEDGFSQTSKLLPDERSLVFTTLWQGFADIAEKNLRLSQKER